MVFFEEQVSAGVLSEEDYRTLLLQGVGRHGVNILLNFADPAGAASAVFIRVSGRLSAVELVPLVFVCFSAKTRTWHGRFSTFWRTELADYFTSDEMQAVANFSKALCDVMEASPAEGDAAAAKTTIDAAIKTALMPDLPGNAYAGRLEALKVAASDAVADLPAEGFGSWAWEVATWRSHPLKESVLAAVGSAPTIAPGLEGPRGGA